MICNNNLLAPCTLQLNLLVTLHLSGLWKSIPSISVTFDKTFQIYPSFYPHLNDSWNRVNELKCVHQHHLHGFWFQFHVLMKSEMISILRFPSCHLLYYFYHHWLNHRIYFMKRKEINWYPISLHCVSFKIIFDFTEALNVFLV